jgi:acyl carrier protein
MSEANYEEILAKLKVKLEATAPGTVLEADSDLASTLALDSMKLINLSLELEDEFDISVPLEELANIRTPGELADLICKQQGVSI